MIDVCIPFYRNFDSFDVALKLIRKHVESPRILLHVQDSDEVNRALAICSGNDLPSTVVSSGPLGDMSEIMDGLFAAGTNRFVLMTEQDVFITRNIYPLVQFLSGTHFDAMGPLDTLFIDRLHAYGRPHYGTYTRLCPKPGYFHSSFILLNRDAVTKIAGGRPFKMPDGAKLFGYGFLGAEPYYGLCERYSLYRDRLIFLRQLHGRFGWSADICLGEDCYARHSYFSSTRDGYLKDGFLSANDHAWLEAEEKKSMEFALQ